MFPHWRASIIVGVFILAAESPEGLAWVAAIAAFGLLVFGVVWLIVAAIRMMLRS